MVGVPSRTRAPRSFPRALVLFTALVVAGVAIAAAGRWRERARATVVELRMSGYAFEESNPTLTFRPGERVRFVVRNEETTRIVHDFRIQGLGVPCGRPLEPGQRREVAVVMPGPGTYVYDCCRHPGMSGRLVVAR